MVGCDEQEHQVGEEGVRPAERKSADGMATPSCSSGGLKKRPMWGSLFCLQERGGHSAPVPRSGTPARARGRGTRRKGASGWVGGGMRPKGASGGVDFPLPS